MKRLQARRLPLLALAVIFASVLGLLLTTTTRRVHAATTITVMNTNDSGAGSLRQAIIDAAAGDTINFAANVTGTITLTSGQFVIRRDLTIDGPGADQLTLSGNNASAIFHIFQVSNFAINRLTIANANGTSAVNNDQSNTTLNDCVVTHNTGQPGGILTTGSSLTLNHCTVSHNMSTNTGGGIVQFLIPGQITINSCTISDNQATNLGGGIYSDIGSVVINNSTISNNSAGQAGGGIYNKSAMTLSNCTVSHNSTSGLGGGIYNSANANLIVTNSTITGNRSTTNSATSASSSARRTSRMASATSASLSAPLRVSLSRMALSRSDKVSNIDVLLLMVRRPFRVQPEATRAQAGQRPIAQTKMHPRAQRAVGC